MSFDNQWEKIYKKKEQINQYPFDTVVSAVNNLFDKKTASKQKVLDLGCGTGNNLRFFLDFGFKDVTGVEGSESAIKIANKILPRNKCNLVFKDFTKYKISKNKFDLILDRGSITHNKKKDIKKVLRKIYLGLSINGYFISHLFSKKHTEFKRIKQKQAFKSSMNLKKQIQASFFSKNEIESFFKNFKIISLSHSINSELKTNYIQGYWHIICKRKK
tara:strand:+ start:1612 stop:2262 length:651 start_codon:yes stop_codon:yes gene_type:complete